MQSQISNQPSQGSLQFVKDLYSLSQKPESQQFVTGIYQMAVGGQPLDDVKANQIASAVSPYLPQPVQSNPFAQNGPFNMMGTAGVPPPAMGGFNMGMGQPAFNPGPIPGTVATAGKKQFYTESDFRNLLSQGKHVCHKQIGGNSDRKGSYCCAEVKTYNQSVPADQQVCATHNRSKKGAAPAMNGAGMASAFSGMSNMSFAPPIGMVGQQQMGGGGMFGQQPQQQQQAPWQPQQQQNPTMGMGGVPNQTMPWQNQQIPGLNINQPNSSTSQGVMPPGLGVITQQNPMGTSGPAIMPLNGMNSSQQNSNPFVINSSPSVGLVGPGTQQQATQQQPTQQQFSPMFQQGPNGQQIQQNGTPQQFQGMTPQQQFNPASQINAPQINIPSIGGVSSTQQQQSVVPPQISIPGLNQAVQSTQQQPQQINMFGQPNGSQMQLNALGGVANIPQSQFQNSGMNQAQSMMNTPQSSGQLGLQNGSVTITQPVVNQQGQVAPVPIPTINMGFNPNQQQNVSMISQSGNSGIDSLNQSMNNMSFTSIPQGLVLPQGAIPQSQHTFFTRKLGEEEFMFSTDPVASGLVFENSINGPVCIGKVSTTVNNSSNPLPPEFKNMIGLSFTIDNDNWLKMRSINKKEFSQGSTETEQISDEYQGEDS